MTTHARASNDGVAATGVILAAGEGRRMGDLGLALPKSCLPVGNRPLIAHHIELLRLMGIADVVVVVGHRGEMVRSQALAHRPPDMAIRFVQQAARRGIADALLLTRELVSDRLVLVLGDTHFVCPDPGLGLRALEGDTSGRTAAILSTREVGDPDRIRRECSVRFDENDRLVEIVEKPVRPFNRLKPCGLYFFTAAIFDAIGATAVSKLRGEVEITDAVQTLVKQGHIVGHAPVVAWDNNITVAGDLLRSNLKFQRDSGRNLLLGAGTCVEAGADLSDSVVGNRVHVPSGTVLRRSLVFDDAPLDPAGGSYCDAIVTRSFVITNCLDEASRDS